MVALGALVPATGAAAAGPAFTMTGSHQLPAGFTRGDEGAQFIVKVQNTGDADSSGAVTVADRLPAGVTATKVTGITTVPPTSLDNPDIASCLVADPAHDNMPSCTPGIPIAAGQALTMTVTLTVKGDAPDEVENVATVTGGGAAAVTMSPPDAVPVGPGGFGVVDFTTSATDQDGVDVTQAGAHPVAASTAFRFRTRLDATGVSVPVKHTKVVETNLPVGFVGNPEAAPKCVSVQAIQDGTCPPGAMVGFARLAQVDTTPYHPDPFFVQMSGIYNVQPDPGQPALFAFWHLGQFPVVLSAKVRSDGDYGLTINVLSVNQPEIVAAEATFCGAGIRTTRFFGGIPSYSCIGADEPPVLHPPLFTTIEDSHRELPFLSNPTECTDSPPATTMRINSWEDPNTWTGPYTAYAHTPPAEPSPVTGCDQLPFAPAVSVDPTSKQPDAPTGLDVGMHFPQDGLLSHDGLATAHLKKAVVTLPEGMTINPSGAGGLTACSDAELKLHSFDPMECPAASKVGTVTATTPLISEKLTGGVYIRSQNSMDPESGEMFRLALVLENKERGISVRLPGAIRADAKTGQLVTTFDNNPRLPVDDLDLKFKSGPRAPLATPATCGPKTIDTQLTSWGGQSVDRQSTFQVPCTSGLGWFGPYFSAGTVNPQAGAHAPFALRVSKPDGQSDLNGIALSLPEGLLANLKGNVGTRVGTARVAAGPGSQPFWLSGPVVLEGPYGGAPFSLRVTVPAIAGPFNLGDVVVRQKIYVDPHDAHVTVVSDPLPTIVKGVPVRLQSLNVDVDKPGFMINPTSCAVKSIGGTLAASTGQTASVASRFQVGGCKNLPLAPKLSLDLIGKKEIKRGKHPKLSTTLTQQPGESGLKKVAVRLPLSLALDPDNAQALCKPEQAAAKACPAGSVIGKATAVSPVLNRPLTGDVFFVEGTRQTAGGRTAKTMPKLWVALRGEVALDVWADSSLENSKYLVTTFGFVPDAPISSFKLDIDGGQHGILAVTGKSDANLCQKPLVAKAQFDGQNGKRVKSHPVMGSPCRFRVQDETLYSTRTKVRVSGIGAGKLTLSGKGVKTSRRTIKRADVASITAKLTASGKRAYKGRKAVRLKVSFNPSAKGEKTHSLRTTVKRAKAKKSKKAKEKSSSTRSQRTR